MDITKFNHIHFTGIKGVGMTALAQCAKDLGIKVTGSDVEEYFVTDETLRKAGIKWQIGFGKKNLAQKPDLVITTGAHGGLQNPEVLEAKNLGLEVITYAEALALFANTKKLISVCGVGGKGTTSSIIATLLEVAELKPSFAIGLGDILPLGISGKFVKSGKYFICEADEYAISPGINNNPKFSLLNPFITVVTNIEHDHPDIYKSLKNTLSVYKKFFQRLPKKGLLVANTDSDNVSTALEGIKIPVKTYGLNKKADWNIKNVDFSEGVTKFKLNNKGNSYEITLQIPGKYNVLNATAAFVVANHIGISIEKIIKGLRIYKGAKRRFEKIGIKNGVIFYDDYAHHSSEIKATLKAAREWFPKKRIIVIFQPHTYSRTKALFKDFSEAFADGDIVGFMDIYASARESKDETISSKLLAKETQKHNRDVYYIGNHEKTLDWIKKITKRGDVVLTLGAGNIFHIYQELFPNRLT